jgi:hypothetical protein
LVRRHGFIGTPSSKDDSMRCKNALMNSGFGRAASEDNRAKIRAALILDYPDHLGDCENVRAAITKRKMDLEPRSFEVKTLPRLFTAQEAHTFYLQVIDKNPWIDRNSEHNAQVVGQIFANDSQMSPKRNLDDMKRAVQIAASANQLERTPPPPPPQTKTSSTKPTPNQTLRRPSRI